MSTAVDSRHGTVPGLSAGLLITLALLSAVAPFATDLYLPAFPAMVADLHTSPTAVQLTLTAFLLGLASGQLVFGPLSDRFGRVKPLVIGAAVCVLASLAAVLAPSIEVLVAARFAQGLTGAAGMVIGRAIISDLATGRAAARAFSLMMIVAGVAPIVAPLAGGFLTGKYQGGAVPEGSRMSLNETMGGRLSPRVFEAVEAYLGVAREFGLDPVHMALAWSARRPFVASSIFGATTMDQLDHMLGASELVLSDDLLARLDEVHKAHPMPY